MDRRKFLHDAGLATAGISLGLGLTSAKPIKKFGIQLYTLRDVIAKDPKGVLNQLASFGYKQIESYSHHQLGIFWGMKNTEFKSYLDSLGIKMISSHYAWDTDTEKLAPQAAEIGMEYLICPYLGKQKSIDDYKRIADNFNKAGEVCKRNGLKFAYHNHGYSFEAMNGVFPQDVMMQACDPALVDFEMDIYWVVTAGQDPEAWLKKYPNRWTLCHVKDRGKSFPANASDASVTLGTGTINFPRILKTARKTGMKHYIVEQERYDNTTSIQCAKDGAAYLKKLSI
jgi:sugar phosphate isomerase/epimerase